MFTISKRIRNTFVGIFVFILCIIIGFFSKEAMCRFSRFILYGWCVYAVIKTVQWVVADSKHWEKYSRKGMNTIFLGALSPMIALLYGYWSIVTEDGQNIRLFSDLSSVKYAVSSLLPVLVLVVCAVIVNFGAGIKTRLFKRGKEKSKVRKAVQRVQRIQEKGFEKDLKNAKTLSEVHMIETEMVKNDITNERDTTSHVAALEDMRKQLEDGTNGQE